METMMIVDVPISAQIAIIPMMKIGSMCLVSTGIGIIARVAERGWMKKGGRTMYESPITLLEGIIKQITEQRENGIYMQIVDQFGVEVDKEELIRALQYDRDQYNKGYRDGKAAAEDELVRCKDCKHWEECEGVCLKIYSDGAVSPYAWQYRKPDDFCSYGEKKDDD